MGTSPFDPEAVFAELSRSGVDYVVIGGIAGTLHGAARSTQDVDVLVGRDPDNLGRLALGLRSLRASLRAGAEEPIDLSTTRTGC